MSELQTQSLTDWLLEQIAEDEGIARVAESGSWHWEHGFGEMCNDPECPFGQLVADTVPRQTVLMSVHGYDVDEGWQGAAHIARHDPARVLAECDAKRRIVELHPLDPVEVYSWGRIGGGCNLCDHDCNSGGGTVSEVPCDTLRALALSYADRPGYRDEWRP